ncbi:MAG TPA: 30S ribosome-binding factor RbfA [Lachnospiraceae bacterium]|jgi:ribosome-binding factor A|nr:30S ribosome-binding factor RbfA [Lachnospiraceae bacterium]
MRKNSVKNTRINSEVLKTLAELFRDGIKDPRVPAFTSVTDVEVAPDLKTCKVYVSFLCDEDKISDALKGVQSAEGYLKRELARRVNLRNTPELRFYVDNSIAYGNHMSKLIEEANKNIKPDEE